MTPCCDKMQEYLDDGGVVRHDDGSLAIPGCCGGGCYVVPDLLFCPFCGEECRSWSTAEVQKA